MDKELKEKELNLEILKKLSEFLQERQNIYQFIKMYEAKYLVERMCYMRIHP